MISPLAIQMAQTWLETQARKIYSWESTTQVGVDYDGTVKTPNFSFTENEAEKLLALQLQYFGEETRMI